MFNIYHLLLLFLPLSQSRHVRIPIPYVTHGKGVEDAKGVVIIEEPADYIKGTVPFVEVQNADVYIRQLKPVEPAERTESGDATPKT